MAQTDNEIKIISARVVSRNSTVTVLDEPAAKTHPKISQEKPKEEGKNVSRRGLWKHLISMPVEVVTTFLREKNISEQNSD
jgi:hypothetical protein